MIKGAAIRVGGSIYTGRSHASIIENGLRGLDVDIDRRQEGFVTDSGEFLDRRAAFQHAAICGQVKERYADGVMLSSYMLKPEVRGA